MEMNYTAWSELTLGEQYVVDGGKSAVDGAKNRMKNRAKNYLKTRAIVEGGVTVVGVAAYFYPAATALVAAGLGLSYWLNH